MINAAARGRWTTTQKANSIDLAIPMPYLSARLSLWTRSEIVRDAYDLLGFAYKNCNKRQYTWYNVSSTLQPIFLAGMKTISSSWVRKCWLCYNIREICSGPTFLATKKFTMNHFCYCKAQLIESVQIMSIYALISHFISTVGSILVQEIQKCRPMNSPVKVQSWEKMSGFFLITSFLNIIHNQDLFIVYSIQNLIPCMKPLTIPHDEIWNDCAAKLGGGLISSLHWCAYDRNLFCDQQTFLT